MILFILALIVIVAGGLWISWRLIGGEPGRHAGHESFDWQDRPYFSRGRPDRLDLLASQYTLPAELLEQIVNTQRLIATADSILHPSRPPETPREYTLHSPQTPHAQRSCPHVPRPPPD